MCYQSPERIRYKGRTYPLFADPLKDYFDQFPPRPDFQPCHTGCYAGYIGEWEVKDRRLFLAGFEEICISDSDVYGVEAIFPGEIGPIEATWFSGQLHIQMGKPIRRFMGGGVKYEREAILTVEYGKVLATESRDNRTPK